MICFLDVDGVLADFYAGVFAYHGKPIPPLHEQVWGLWDVLGMTENEFWSSKGREFWANLSPTLEMSEIISVVEGIFGSDVFLCTSPCLTHGCATGKAEWVEKHLPQYSRRLLLTNHKELFAGPHRVLVDDHDMNCQKWAENDGLVCMFPRPWNRLGHRDDAISLLAGLLGKYAQCLE